MLDVRCVNCEGIVQIRSLSTLSIESMVEPALSGTVLSVHHVLIGSVVIVPNFST